VSVRRSLAAALLAGSLVVGLGLGAAACSSEQDSSGATTNLDEVGPDLARLRQEVQQLRAEVRALREQLATVTNPATVLPLVTTTTQPLR
jgi:outer membrane murein-binding lipoprotein Lpp